MEQETIHTQGDFEAEFNRRVDSILSRAKAAGLNVSQICIEAGIARATPDRWRKEAPLSIKLVDRLDEAVSKAEQAASEK